MSSVKKIDAHSENAIHSGLNIFGVPPTHVSVNRTHLREILPLNTVDESPYEFRVFSDNQWLDLSKTYLYLRLQIQKKDGETWKAIDALDTDVAPVQQIGQSFVEQLKMHVNGTEIYDSSTHYPYIAYMKNELNYSTDVKDTWLTASGYYRDIAMDNKNSDGFKARSELMGEGNICEFISRLDFDLANQNLYLLNNLDVLFTIYKKNDKFLIHALSPGTTEYRIKVYAAKLYIKTVEVQPSLNLSVLNLLQKTSAKYPLRRTEVRTRFIDAGRTEVTFNAFTNVLPRRLVIGMVANNAYVGRYQNDPFNFKPFDVKTVSVNAGGIIHPSVAYQMEWTRSPRSFFRPYVDLMDATSVTANTTNGITPFKFKSGWTFFVITLTSTLEDSDGFELVKSGTTTLHLEFNSPLAEGVELIVLGEFDQLLSIDQNRVVVGDGVV